MKQENRYGYLIIPVSMALIAVGLVYMLNLTGVQYRSSSPDVVPTAYSSPTPRPTEAPVAVADVAAGFDPAVVRAGQTSFASICSACHGMNARGIPGLGKDLVMGEYVNSIDDEELFRQIVNGRQPNDPLNTTGVLMPARGGNPAFTDDQIREIVVYLRSLHAQAAGEAVALGPATPAPTYNPNFTLPIAGLGGGSTSDEATEEATLAPTVEPTSAPAADATDEVVEASGVAFNPAEAYMLSCGGCHGANGEGTPLNGTALVGNPLVENSPTFVFTYLTSNLPPPDPRDAYPHPMWGAYPLLNADQLNQLIDYLRTLG